MKGATFSGLTKMRCVTLLLSLTCIYPLANASGKHQSGNALGGWSVDKAVDGITDVATFTATLHDDLGRSLYIFCSKGKYSIGISYGSHPFTEGDDKPLQYRIDKLPPVSMNVSYDDYGPNLNEDSDVATFLKAIGNGKNLLIRSFVNKNTPFDASFPLVGTSTVLNRLKESCLA